MTHHRFRGRAKNNSAQAGAAVRRNYNQINLMFRGHAHNLGGGIAMHDDFFDREAIELISNCSLMSAIGMGSAKPE